MEGCHNETKVEIKWKDITVRLMLRETKGCHNET